MIFRPIPQELCKSRASRPRSAQRFPPGLSPTNRTHLSLAFLHLLMLVVHAEDACVMDFDGAFAGALSSLVLS